MIARQVGDARYPPGHQRLRHRDQDQRPADAGPAAGPPRPARRLNYTLRPETWDQAAGIPDPFDQPSPDLAWLVQPTLTGLAPQQWDALITTLMTLHDQQRKTSLDKRRGHRPRLIAAGVGRRSVLTLADRLLATVLHQRLALPQTVIASLFGVRPGTVNNCICDIRQLLNQAGYTIQPGPHRLASLEDLSNLAAAEGIHSSTEINTAC